MKLEVLSADGVIKGRSDGAEIDFVYDRGYEDGDKIVLSELEGDFVSLTFSKDMVESTVYCPSRRIEFDVPRGERSFIYHPDAFSDAPQEMKIRICDDEAFGYRNIAKNAIDFTENTETFPHAETNILRGMLRCDPRNAIDGVTLNRGHGIYPYQSWAGGATEDIEYCVRFGRAALVRELVFYLRADFERDHDTYWKSLRAVFSDGTSVPMSFEKTDEPQRLVLPEAKRTEFVRLCDFKQAVLPLSWAALSQLEVYGEIIK